MGEEDKYTDMGVVELSEDGGLGMVMVCGSVLMRGTKKHRSKLWRGHL